jgi:hypothetical protein
MGHNIEQGAGGLSFVEIQRFCGICPTTFEIDCKCIPMDRYGLFITQVYALKSGARLCGQKFTQDFSFKIHLLLQTDLQNLVRFNSKSVLCRKMFAQDFCFIKIHLFLQNVLQNLVRSTSKRVTFWCFCYF